MQAEQKQIETSIENGLHMLPLFLKGDAQAAMLELHSKTN
jgi:PTH1 family peptidyl-tRNA hydrolase